MNLSIFTIQKKSAPLCPIFLWHMEHSACFLSSISFMTLMTLLVSQIPVQGIPDRYCHPMYCLRIFRRPAWSRHSAYGSMRLRRFGIDRAHTGTMTAWQGGGCIESQI